MKHARKMVLVDIEKKPCELVNAINSLTSSEEFSRAYFGSSAVSVSHLDNELKHLIERKDLDPSEKLKLYSQSLNRYLFLQRTPQHHTQQNIAPVQIVQAQPTAVDKTYQRLNSTISESGSEAESFSSVPTGSFQDTTLTPTNKKEPLDQSSPVTPKAVYESKRGPVSNLPRTSPKESYLRPPKEKQYKYATDFFVDWLAKPK